MADFVVMPNRSTKFRLDKATVAPERSLSIEIEVAIAQTLLNVSS